MEEEEHEEETDVARWKFFFPALTAPQGEEGLATGASVRGRRGHPIGRAGIGRDALGFGIWVLFFLFEISRWRDFSLKMRARLSFGLLAFVLAPAHGNTKTQSSSNKSVCIHLI